MLPLLAEFFHIIGTVGAGMGHLLSEGILQALIWKDRVVDHKIRMVTDALDSETPAQWIESHTRLGWWTWLYTF